MSSASADRAGRGRCGARAGRHLVALILCGLATAPVLAQSGSLEVVVLDGESGDPLAGATVTLTNDRQLIRETTILADERGVVEFPVLGIGPGYRVEIGMPGFARQRLLDLRIRIGEKARRTVQLSPELTEKVEVTAKRSVVDIEKTGNSTKFSDEFIEGLPVPGRFYQNMLTLAPGVVDADEDGNPNVHGARSRDFKATVAGISNVDPLTGEWLGYVHPESIDEMEIITSGAGAEFGRAQGGFARIMQKQGSNEFEGVATFIFRSSKLDGDGAGSSAAGQEVDFDWVQPSFQISGALIKDKLWYRLSHEYIKREDPVNLIGSLATTTRTQSINSDQLTWQVSPRNKLTFQFQYDPLEIENVGISSRVSPSASHTMKKGGTTYAMRWTVPQSPRLLIDSSVAYQEHDVDFVPTDPDARQECSIFPIFTTFNRTRCENESSGRVTGAYPETWLDERQRLTVTSKASFYVPKFLGTSHRIDFGLTVENERYFRELERRPDIRFNVQRGIGPPVGIATVRVSVPESSEGRATGTSWGLYAEDQIRPTSGLSVTLGLRIDREEISGNGILPFDPKAEAMNFAKLISEGISPINAARQSFTAYDGAPEFLDRLAEQVDVPRVLLSLGPAGISSGFWPRTQRVGNINLSDTYLSPRFSLAWDPWRNGKTKLAVSAGRYHDKIFLAVPLTELEPVFTDLTTFSFLEGGRFVAEGLPGGLNTAISTQMVDRDLTAPYQDEFALTVERELWAESSIKLTYVRRKYRNQLQDIDINHESGDFGRCLRPAPIGAGVILSSPGEGQTLIDPSTGREYIDTDPGPGDGRIDDCTGDLIRFGGNTVNAVDFEFPDGLADLYPQNPGWGELLLIGNFNSTDYDAFVLELVRRQYRSWQMNASYTWSEAIGDAEDFDQTLGNEKNLLEDERGFLSYDQRHVVKLNAISLTPWGFRIGGTVRWESGLPYSVQESRLTLFATPPQFVNLGDRSARTRIRFPTRQRNDQRNPSFWTCNVRLAKEFRLRQKADLQVTAEVFNLLNDDTLILTDRRNGLNSGVRRFGRQFQVGLRLAF